ncbi:MAG: hypothetical protein KAH38_04720, partial [Candidatus Hydrogenedentes bacterium]|nr:hypothetical protein [Candidatus Hydrogenedentota bacterium]
AQTLRITVPLSSDDAAAFAAAMNEAVADFAIRSAKVIALVEPPLSLLPKEIPRVATPQEQP